MTVGIAGLGLIGGSFAKAWHEAGHRVLACNRTRAVLDFALMSGEVDGELTKENIQDCDLVLVCLPPEAAIAWVTETRAKPAGASTRLTRARNSMSSYTGGTITMGAPRNMSGFAYL